MVEFALSERRSFLICLVYLSDCLESLFLKRRFRATLFDNSLLDGLACKSALLQEELHNQLETLMKQELEVRQHNTLTNTRYEYTELQLDLLFFLLSKLRKHNTVGIYKLLIRELSEIVGKRYDYTYLRKATEGTGSRMFEVETDAQVLQLWMFRYVKYLKGKGIIEIKLSEKMLPYLFDLKNNFTSFELLSALRLTSKHAKRIYTICSQWKDLGETKKCDIQDLKRMLGLVDEKGKEEYTEITTFKKFVLDVAVRQTNEHTDLCISYQPEKCVRSYKNVVFKVELQAVDIVATLPDLTVAGHSCAPGRECWPTTRAVQHHHARPGGANPG